MSLRVKLLSAFFLLIIVPLFLLGMFTYVVSQELLEKKYGS